MPIVARLKSYDPRAGHVLRTLGFGGHVFEAGGQAIPVTADQAAFLAGYRNIEGNAQSPLAFDICDDTAAPLPPVAKAQPKSGPITAGDWNPDTDGGPDGEDADTDDGEPEEPPAPARVEDTKAKLDAKFVPRPAAPPPVAKGKAKR